VLLCIAGTTGGLLVDMRSCGLSARMASICDLPNLSLPSTAHHLVSM
jgi:hypothetical protein